MRNRSSAIWRMRFAVQVIVLLCVPVAALAAPADGSLSPTNIFAPVSTPAHSILGLSLFVLAVTAAIFVIVFSLLVYCVVRFGKRADDDGREPAQVYGSNQVELAWTVIPVLIIVVLFLATAQVIASIQKAAQPGNAIQVIAIGHQFWWEYRYPGLKVVTANELHVPVSDPAQPTPTFITLLSADTDHSFWVPRLAGKTDLIPNHPNTMWIDPQPGKTDLIPNHPNTMWIDPQQPGSTWASARNIVERNTPRCFSASMCNPARSSTAGLKSKVGQRKRIQQFLRGSAFSRRLPVSTVMP